ncbi:MAG: response regulator [Agathobacter sp.]|nr:response regulator [Agathobacter sp.]MBQ2902661.1 response regulator [Agathobacter sp.]
MLRILIIDDVETNRFVLRNIITDMGYQPVLAENGKQGLKIMERIVPDLILLDVAMPEMDGFEFADIIKKDVKTRNIPVIFISAFDAPQDIVKGFEAGGADYVTKPFIQEVVKSRVTVQLKLAEMNKTLADTNRRLQVSITEQLRQLEAEKKKVLYALLTVVRKNAVFDESHIERLQENCKILAQAMQLSPKYESIVSDTFVETIELAAPLCDLGMVGVPLDILQKNGKLTEEEMAIMQKHTAIGTQIMEDIKGDGDYNDFVDMSCDITKYHHERWDGSGYPYGKSGNDIPLPAQVVSLISYYNALTEKRSYRDAYSKEEAIQMIEAESGKAFNPEIFAICKKIARQLK